MRFCHECHSRQWPLLIKVNFITKYLFIYVSEKKWHINNGLM